jgi:hypothetical protein
MQYNNSNNAAKYEPAIYGGKVENELTLFSFAREREL